MSIWKTKGKLTYFAGSKERALTGNRGEQRSMLVLWNQQKARKHCKKINSIDRVTFSSHFTHSTLSPLFKAPVVFSQNFNATEVTLSLASHFPTFCVFDTWLRLCTHPQRDYHQNTVPGGDLRPRLKHF